MPANPKHLEKSNWQRFAKITAGILGGYAISFLVHPIFLLWFNEEAVMGTASYTLFIVWIILLMLPFFFKNGWKCWLIYVTIIIILSTLLYLL